MAAAEIREVLVTEPPTSTFPAYDYADAFTVTKRPGDHRSAEQWIRNALDDTPWAFHTFVPILWRYVVGFRLGPIPSPEHVLGWRVVDIQPDVVELRNESWQATAAVVFRVGPERVLFTTFMRYERRQPARIMWTVLAPVHRFFVPLLLRWAR